MADEGELLPEVAEPLETDEKGVEDVLEPTLLPVLVATKDEPEEIPLEPIVPKVGVETLAPDAVSEEAA